jgi:hypothetical protein
MRYGYQIKIMPPDISGKIKRRMNQFLNGGNEKESGARRGVANGGG